VPGGSEWGAGRPRPRRQETVSKPERYNGRYISKPTHPPTHPPRYTYNASPISFIPNTSTQSPRAPALLASEGVISPVLYLKTHPPTHRYNARYIFRFGDGLLCGMILASNKRSPQPFYMIITASGDLSINTKSISVPCVN